MVDTARTRKLTKPQRAVLRSINEHDGLLLRSEFGGGYRERALLVLLHAGLAETCPHPSKPAIAIRTTDAGRSELAASPVAPNLIFRSSET